MELITVINCRLFVTNEYQWGSLSSFMTGPRSPTDCVAAGASVEIFLSPLRVDAEEEDIRVKFVAKLPSNLAVQLAKIVGHYSGGQTEQESQLI